MKDEELKALLKSEAQRKLTEKMLTNVPPAKMRKKRFQDLRTYLNVLRVNNSEKYRKITKGSK